MAQQVLSFIIVTFEAYVCSQSVVINVVFSFMRMSECEAGRPDTIAPAVVPQ